MSEIAAWAWRNNDDEPLTITLDEPEICWEKKPLVFLNSEDQQASFIQGAYDQGRADIGAQIAPHLHLIWVFANDLTQRNFMDKSDYIKQQVDRIRSALNTGESN